MCLSKKKKGKKERIKMGNKEEKLDLWELFILYTIEREYNGHKSHAIFVSDFSDMFSYWRDTSHVLLIRLTRS